MPGEAEKLSRIFQIKEESEKYLANLEKLKSDGSVTPDIYSSLKSEYDQKLKVSLSEIDRIKDEIKNSLSESLREKEALIDDLTKIEVKYKVNELSREEYETSQSTIEGKIKVLTSRINELNKLLEAKSSADIATPTEEIPAAPPEARPPARETSAGKRFKLPSRRILMGIGAVVIVIIIIIMAVVLISGGEKQIEEVTIPVDIIGGNNIGSIHFELTYDTAVLEPVDVVSGAVSGDALFEYDITGEGRATIGIVSSAGINGDGSIAEITFTINDGAKSSTPLVLENVSAYNSQDLSRLSISFIAGSYEAKDNSFTIPTLSFTNP